MLSRNGVSNELGLLCDQLTRHETMAAEIDRAGAGQHLSELLALVASGPGPEEAEEGRVGELLELIEDACSANGLPPLDTRDHNAARLPPGMQLPPGFQRTPGEPEVKAWVCPWDRCGRVALPDVEAAATPPRCAAGDTPMRPFHPHP